MNTVDFVLALLGTLSLSTLSAIAWAIRERFRAESAQREIVRLVNQQRYALNEFGLIDAIREVTWDERKHS